MQWSPDGVWLAKPVIIGPSFSRRKNISKTNVSAASPDTSLTPSQLNRQVRSLLESHFDFVWVEGEISNFACPSSGHWYFTLKDDSAQVRCAMFRNRNQRLRFIPDNGDLVRLRARVSLYEGRGEFQLIGEFMEPAGAGALQAQFEALRDKLRAEGLFDAERKRPLPTSVSHLAVISSPTGAALQDILQVLERRNPSIRVTVLPSPVQGAQAAEQLRAALLAANALAESLPEFDFDAIILARGGGSLEDLWAFNDEALARAIVDSALPVVAGVGHEVDVTIADFAADMRAPTPSAAAELLSEDRAELLAQLAGVAHRLQRSMQHRLELSTLQLAQLRARLRHPGDRLREQAQRLDDLEVRLRRAVNLRLEREQQKQAERRTRLLALSPVLRIARTHELIDRQQSTLTNAVTRRLERERQAFVTRQQVLDSLNPLAVLKRGYAILSDSDGRVLRDSGDTSPGQQLQARLARGRLTVNVEKAEKG
jgi:exodeoxyribonuclease VII large subunit